MTRHPIRTRVAFWLVLLAACCWLSPAWAQGEPAAAAEAPATEAPATEAPATEAPADETPATEAPAAEAGPATAPGGVPGATPTPPTAPGTPEEPEAEVETALDGATFAVRLRDLAQRVERLKEQTRRAHMRMSLLSETVLSGALGSARIRITFDNELTAALKLTRVLIVVDGIVQYNKRDDSGRLADTRKIPVLSSSLTPGDHTIQVLLRLDGHGYGVFSYVQGYKFEIKSSHTFTLKQDDAIELSIIAWEKGDVTTPLEQRPAVRYATRAMPNIAPATQKPAPKPPANPTPSASGGVSIGAGAPPKQ